MSSSSEPTLWSLFANHMCHQLELSHPNCIAPSCLPGATWSQLRRETCTKLAAGFPYQMASSALHVVPTLRALIVMCYFALTLLLYTRAPSGGARFAASGFPSSSASGRLGTGDEYGSVGAFGDMMITMLGPTDVPFTLFVPSHGAFLNVSSMFRKIAEKGEKLDATDTESDTYAVMSHLLSFSAVPKPVLSKYVPVGKEAVYETLSGFLLSLARVPGRGLLVNNVTCAVTDLRRGRLVIHVLDGVLMDFGFEQSMLQESAPAGEEDGKDDVDQEEDVSEDREQQSHV